MAEPQKKSNTGLIIGIVVIVVIALGWYFYGSNADDVPATSTVETTETPAPDAVDPVITDPVDVEPAPETAPIDSDAVETAPAVDGEGVVVPAN